MPHGLVPTGTFGQIPHLPTALRLTVEFQVQGGVSVADKCIQGGRQPDMALTIKVHTSQYYCVIPTDRLILRRCFLRPFDSTTL